MYHPFAQPHLEKCAHAEVTGDTKGFLWPGPKWFLCPKCHRPAKTPQSAQGYHGSCSMAIGGCPEEAKPFIWNQSPGSCWSGWSEIWIWTAFDKWLCWARFWADCPMFVSTYSVNREPVLPTTTSPARPPHHASRSSRTSWWHFIIHCITLLCESPPELCSPQRIYEFLIKGNKE